MFDAACATSLHAHIRPKAASVAADVQPGELEIGETSHVGVLQWQMDLCIDSIWLEMNAVISTFSLSININGLIICGVSVCVRYTSRASTPSKRNK